MSYSHKLSPAESREMLQLKIRYQLNPPDDAYERFLLEYLNALDGELNGLNHELDSVVHRRSEGSLQASAELGSSELFNDDAYERFLLECMNERDGQVNELSRELDDIVHKRSEGPPDAPYQNRAELELYEECLRVEDFDNHESNLQQFQLQDSTCLLRGNWFAADASLEEVERQCRILEHIGMNHLLQMDSQSEWLDIDTNYSTKVSTEDDSANISTDDDWCTADSFDSYDDTTDMKFNEILDKIKYSRSNASSEEEAWVFDAKKQIAEMIVRGEQRAVAPIMNDLNDDYFERLNQTMLGVLFC
jgi:hypothetical protein